MAIRDFFGFKFLRNTPKEERVSFAPPMGDGKTVEETGSAGGAHYTQIFDLDNFYQSEEELIRRYRELSLFAEVDTAIGEIVSEAIAEDEVGDIIALDLSECDFDDRIKAKIQTEFDTVVSLFDVESNGTAMFRQFYIDGKIYYHPVIDSKNIKAGIKEFRPIDPTKITKINPVEIEKDPRTGVDMITSKEPYFLFNTQEGMSNQMTSGIPIAEDSIIYATSGIQDATTGLILSHLHKAIRPANQLRMLEDANIIYFLARAPMRRMFYVDTGSLPNHKAEQYVKQLMDQYRNKIQYDSTTGEVKDSKNILTMLEDIWLPRRDGNKSTEIETLEGSQGLAQQLESIEYFKKKLYTSLNLPHSRMDQASQFNVGRATEITRDEVKFAKFIDSLRRRFANIFIQSLRIQVLLRGIMTVEDWEAAIPNIKIVFAKDNHFASLKELDVLSTRLDVLDKVKEHIGTRFSASWVDRHVLGFTDEEIAEMRGDILREKEDPTEQDPAGDDMGMGGFGGDGGAPEMDYDTGVDFSPTDQEDTFDHMEPEAGLDAGPELNTGMEPNTGAPR